MEYKNYEYADFFDTVVKQKVLEFFNEHPKGSFSTKQISDELKMPQASINRALNELHELGILGFSEEGRFKNFSIEPEVQKEFEKVFNYLDHIRQFTIEQRAKAVKSKRGSEK